MVERAIIARALLIGALSVITLTVEELPARTSALLATPLTVATAPLVGGQSW